MRERLQVQSLRMVHVIQMQGAYMRIVVRCRIQGYTLLQMQVQRMWRRVYAYLKINGAKTRLMNWQSSAHHFTELV